MEVSDIIELAARGEDSRLQFKKNITAAESMADELAAFATKEWPYRGLGAGIRMTMATLPGLKLESDPDRNLFLATIPRNTGNVC